MLTIQAAQNIGEILPFLDQMLSLAYSNAYRGT